MLVIDVLAMMILRTNYSFDVSLWFRGNERNEETTPHFKPLLCNYICVQYDSRKVIYVMAML